MSSTKSKSKPSPDSKIDPASMAVMANRLDAIVREMSSTLLRAGRSAVINVARDFSCSIVTGDDELLASAEGLPVHVFGSQLQAAEMRRRHPTLQEGDAYLDNDPYVGNSHQADHTILVPVFVYGVHVFTAVAKAHQADIGNSAPTTYYALAKDVYEEGALSFPCVRIQQDYTDVGDIIEMCRRRIRVSDQWYGDYLAMIGAARTGERRLKEFVDAYGMESIRAFVRDWFDYSERRMVKAIEELRSGTYTRSGQHDRVGHLDPIPLEVTVTVDSDAAKVEIDLTNNPDCVPAGLNLTRATASNMAIAGLFGNLDPDIPHNAGSFRRVQVHLRENCVAGIPLHPACTSAATTNVASRILNLTQAALSQASRTHGVAEGGAGMGPGLGVVAGVDQRTGTPFVNQLIIGSNGGPASVSADGWLNWIDPSAAGLLYRDSVEIDEQKYPVHFEYLRVVTDSGGAGEFRGAPGLEVAYTVRGGETTAMWVLDSYERPAHGIHGGESGQLAEAAFVASDGSRTVLPGTIQMQVLQPGEVLVSLGAGGGGCGNPIDRHLDSVVQDVLEGYVSPSAAESVYGVVLAGEPGRGLKVNEEATRSRRKGLRGSAQ